MGNSQANSTYPEQMLRLTTIEELNEDIDSFNEKQLNARAMKVLGFLVQFEDIPAQGLKKVFSNMFFQSTLARITIKTNILYHEQRYIVEFKVAEMYKLAELIGRFIEEDDDDTKQSDQNYIRTSQKKNIEVSGSFDDKQCPLCLDERIKIILPCMHGYCEACARKWIQEKQQKSCPMCRFEVEASQSKFNRTIMQIEDDMQNLQASIKQEIIQIIREKNTSIPHIK